MKEKILLIIIILFIIVSTAYAIRDYISTTTISSAITLNANTSVKIADANNKRSFFYVTNDGDAEVVWIKLQAASVDNDKKGIFLNSKGTSPNTWEMSTNSIYIGEISAIAGANSPNVYITEY